MSQRGATDHNPTALWVQPERLLEAMIRRRRQRQADCGASNAHGLRPFLRHPAKALAVVGVFGDRQVVHAGPDAQCVHLLEKCVARDSTTLFLDKNGVQMAAVACVLFRLSRKAQWKDRPSSPGT